MQLLERWRVLACERLDGERAFFHAMADGLMCIRHKRLDRRNYRRISRQLASEIFRSPIDTFEKCPWPKERRPICGRCWCRSWNVI